MYIKKKKHIKTKNRNALRTCADESLNSILVHKCAVIRPLQTILFIR